MIQYRVVGNLPFDRHPTNVVRTEVEVPRRQPESHSGRAVKEALHKAHACPPCLPHVLLMHQRRRNPANEDPFRLSPGRLDREIDRAPRPVPFEAEQRRYVDSVPHLV